MIDSGVIHHVFCHYGDGQSGKPANQITDNVPSTNKASSDLLVRLVWEYCPTFQEAFISLSYAKADFGVDPHIQNNNRNFGSDMNLTC